MEPVQPFSPAQSEPEGKLKRKINFTQDIEESKSDEDPGFEVIESPYQGRRDSLSNPDKSYLAKVASVVKDSAQYVTETLDDAQ